MLSIQHDGLRLCDQIHRREWLRIGGTALGALSLPNLLRARSSPSQTSHHKGKAKSIIVFGLTGGPSQYDTWDPKPEAPVEIRGAFGTIPSATPGFRVGELMPATARLTDRLAVLRALVTNDNAHSTSGYQMLTGVPHQPLNMENALARAPNFSPSLGALVRWLRPSSGLPSAVTLPEHIWNDGNLPWPGQDAGVLGPRFNPWVIMCDPASPNFIVPDFGLADGMTTSRLQGRRALLDQVQSRLDQPSPVTNFDAHAQRAYDLLTSPAARRAFHIDDEPAKLRDRYGRSRFAQSVLLARRLVEAGVSLVQINWTRIPNQPNQGGWDTHEKHHEAMKSLLMPMMDRCFSALIEDLEERGMLDDTLVVWFGEFGRTPKFNAKGGRDHWGHVFSLALAGGGVRGGAVHGKSDRQAAYPIDGRSEASDFLATIFHCLGYAPDTEIRDSLDRPIPLSRGQPISAILA